MIIATSWKTVILLCGKCARKLDGRFGHKNKEALRTALRTELKTGGLHRGFRVIEMHCLGICPKKAVTAINASSPGRIVTVPKNARADEALDLILGSGVDIGDTLVGR